MPPEDWVTRNDERARYDHHDNQESNRGYVDFLSQVADVVAQVAKPPAPVLDFGAGENAVLTGLLRGRGYDCTAYDPLYGLGQAALAGHYQVIVLCEVIEHLRDLRDEILALCRCLAPGGSLVVRTRCYPSLGEIPAWWYARDITHINLFSRPTLAVAASLCGLACHDTRHADITIWRRA